MRNSVRLSAVILLLVVGMAVALVACGGNPAAGSSTTLGTVGGSTTTAPAETTTTVTGEETTTSVTATGDTTSSDTTSTSEAATTTTEAAPTTDTADHTAELRTYYQSTESFDNSNWATLNAAPAGHLGAAVDIKGQPAKVTVDPDSKYLTWQLTVSGLQITALCRTNITIDRTLLSGGSSVEVKGTVVGAQAPDAGGGPIIYVESVQKAA